VAAVAAPSLGQHTAQVLQEAGFTDQQIEKLRELAVI
jgi:crotonobetainyl-CoA:carnitine CoA-transferase CaiB-like acyl-CoA transferase